MAMKLSKRINSIWSGTRSRVIFIIVSVIVLVALGVGIYLGYESYNFVSTDNARISAPLIYVTALSPCQLISLDVDYGSYVEKGQRIATVGQPLPTNPVDKQGLRQTPMGRSAIEAPVTGYVAAVWSFAGQVINTGTYIVTLYDVSDTWVIANITEADLYRIEPGQPVEIAVDTLGGLKLNGKVEGIAAASAATFSLLPQNNTTGNFIKVAQLVPVKISIENPGNYILIPGTSVEVKIKTR